MRRDEPKLCGNDGDASSSIAGISKCCRHMAERQFLTNARHGTGDTKSYESPEEISNQMHSKCRKNYKRNLQQCHSEEFIRKLNSEASLRLHLKAFILVTLFLVVNLSSTAAVATGWVRQSLSSFNVEDQFHRFVEATGGNREKFRFDGNFFSSPEKSDVWDKPSDGSSSGKQLRPDSHSKNAPLTHEISVPSTQEHEDEMRVHRSFYIDIFDSSLPADSPHQKSLRESRLPRPPQQSLPFGAKMQLPVTKNPYFFSGTQTPFHNEFLSTSMPQKSHRLKNFTFQRLGRKTFPNSEGSNKKSIVTSTTQDPAKLLSDGGSAQFEPKPGGVSNALVTEFDGSSRLAESKPRIPIFTSTFYQSPDGTEPAMGTLSLGFPPSPGKKKDGASAVNRSSENRAKSRRTSGCVDEDGIFRQKRERWFGRGCTRHTCVVFRSRSFIETDSCESEVRNTSYRCFRVANERARYPLCCPTYTCHPDNLGRPNDRS